MQTQHHIRSFGRRGGRTSFSVKQAKNKHWQDYGLEVADGMLNVASIFNRDAKLSLEIGFGSGTSLLALAKQYPHINFIGIETYLPAVGALLLALKKENISNVRLYNDDALHVLKLCIPDTSLSAVQIFFPDPWPKRRHHHRRLIQPDFLNLLIAKLQQRGTLHLATDWQDYADHMLQVLAQHPGFINQAAEAFVERSPYRPVMTKFEKRALQSGRNIWDLCFIKQT